MSVMRYFLPAIAGLFLSVGASAQSFGPSINAECPYGAASGCYVTAAGGTSNLPLSTLFTMPFLTPSFGATTSGNNNTAINAAVAAAVAAGGGVVRIPGGYFGTTALATQPNPLVVLEWDGPNINRADVGLPSAATDAGKVFSGVLGTSRPSGNNRAGVSDMFYSQGSGANGANNGDFAHSFHLYKENYTCTTARAAALLCSTIANQGEIDGLYIATYQGGPDATSSSSLKSANALIAGQATCVNGIGFCASWEMKTIILDELSLAEIYNMDLQAAVINTRTAEAGRWGMIYNMDVGAATAGILFQNVNGASSWGDIIQNNYNGTRNFQIDDAGRVKFGPASGSSQIVITSTTDLSDRTQTSGLQVINGSGIVKAKINSDGSGGFSTGLVDATTTAWVTSTAYIFGQTVVNSGKIYRVSNVGGTSANAPTHSSGCTTGGDSITWCYIATSADAVLVDSTGNDVRLATTPFVRSSQTTPVDVPIYSGSGTPAAVVTSPSGGLYLRTGGTTSRTLYVAETTGVNGWNPVDTNSVTNSITATGSTLAGAYVVPSKFNEVTTVAAGTGVALTGSTFVGEQIIINAGANTLNVYPPSGSAQINALGNGTADTIVTGSQKRYFCKSTTQCRITGS